MLMRTLSCCRVMASAHDSRVAPVVMTSSTSRMCRPAILSGCSSRNMFATFVSLSVCESVVWLGLEMMRNTLLSSMGMPVMSAMPRAIHRLWLYPLWRSFCRDNGTGMMMSISLKKSVRRRLRAMLRPMKKPISGRLRYFRSKRICA